MDSDGDGDADLGPALRLVGIVGFLVSAAGFLHLRMGVAPDLPEGSGGILGQLVGTSLFRGFGPLGANLFTVALLLISTTLATGLSWLGVMDRIGQGVLALGPLLAKLTRRGTQQASEWQQARAFREEREETRKYRQRTACQARAGEDRAARTGTGREERPRQARTADPAVPCRRRHRHPAAGAARRSQAADQGLQRRDAGNRVAADRIQAQGLPHRCAGRRRLSRPGDHPLRAATRRRASRSARSPRSTRTSRAACR